MSFAQIFLIVLAVVLGVGGAVIYHLMSVNRENQAKSKKSLEDLQTALNAAKTQLVHDVSEIHELQSKAAQSGYMGFIVSQMPTGTICIADNGTVILSNPYADQFLESAPAAGKQYKDVLHFLLNVNIDYHLFDRAFSGQVQTLPPGTEIQTQRGTIPVTGTIAPLSTGGAQKILLFTFSDNSQNVARVEEEKSFFSAAAHELRTPLTAIKLSTSLLLEQYDALGREKIIDYLKKTGDSAEYLVKLVNNYLNLSRIEQGRLAVEVKPFNIISLTDEVIKELTPLVRERHLFIQHEQMEDEFRNTVGDPVKTKEILTNLISNSIKYTIEGGITISHKTTPTTMITLVTDTGNGITMEQKNMLFKRFMRVGAGRQQSSEKSSGLGLYISKKIAQLMRGDVKLESSEPGKGSTFAFTLPLVAKT